MLALLSYWGYSMGMNKETADLLAIAEARAEAHAGLGDALEYGYVSSLRIHGIMTLTARGGFGTFRVTFDSVGTPTCNGHVLRGTNRLLALDALSASRASGPHARG